MKRNRSGAQKAALDNQTPYMTLLPAMDEGFHSGYQTRPGIVSDGNIRPHLAPCWGWSPPNLASLLFG